MPYYADDLLAMIVGGTPASEDWVFDGLNLQMTHPADRTRTVVFDCAGISTATQRTMTWQDNNYIIAGTNIAQTFSGANTFTAKQTFALQSGPSTVIETATTLTTGLSAGNSSGLWNLAPTFSDAAGGVGAITCQRINAVVTNATDNFYRGLNLVINVTPDDTLSTGGCSINGLDFIARDSGTMDSSAIRGIQAVAQHGSAGTLQDLICNNAAGTVLTGGGNVTSLVLYNVSSSSIATGATVTNYYTFKGFNPTGSGSITTQYGLYLPALSKGATTWAIFSLGGNSSHLGNFKFGANTAPAAKVDIAAGTAAAGTAPLKFATGTSLTAAVAGVMEFTTDDLFFTITTGTARKAFVLDDGTRLTSGTTPVATTNGRLIDGLVLTSGVYTPTRSAEANIVGTVTTTQAQFMRVGSVVTVSGRYTVDPVTTLSATSFEITLPVASNIGAVEDLTGVAVIGNTVNENAEIIGSIANNTAVVQWVAADVASRTWSYVFTYRVV